VRARPDATLRELREALGIEVSLQTIHSILRELKISFKKGSSAEFVGCLWGNQLRRFPQTPSLGFFPLRGEDGGVTIGRAAGCVTEARGTRRRS
jgi:hypothetical protein